MRPPFVAARAKEKPPSQQAGRLVLLKRRILILQNSPCWSMTYPFHKGVELAKVSV
jgi:hypothetical protein